LPIRNNVKGIPPAEIDAVIKLDWQMAIAINILLKARCKMILIAPIPLPIEVVPVVRRVEHEQRPVNIVSEK